MTSASSLTVISGRPGEDTSRCIPAGETVLHAPSGAFIRNDLAGGTSLVVPTGIDTVRIADIKAHRVTYDAEGVSHYVRLHGGGEFHLTFDTQGAVLSLHGERVSITLNDSGLIVTKWEGHRDPRGET